MKAIGVIDERAVGIDVGSEKLHVSIGGETARIFGTVTGELYQLRDWLLSEGVKQVAMEATGVYWLCPYEVLSAAGRMEGGPIWWEVFVGPSPVPRADRFSSRSRRPPAGHRWSRAPAPLASANCSAPGHIQLRHS